MTLVGDVRHRVRLTVDDAVLGCHQVCRRRRRQLLQAECLVVDTLADRVVVVGHVAAVTRAMQLSARDVEVKRREARAVLVGAHGTCGVEPRMSLVALRGGADGGVGKGLRLVGLINRIGQRTRCRIVRARTLCLDREGEVIAVVPRPTDELLDHVDVRDALRGVVGGVFDHEGGHVRIFQRLRVRGVVVPPLVTDAVANGLRLSFALAYGGTRLVYAIHVAVVGPCALARVGVIRIGALVLRDEPVYVGLLLVLGVQLAVREGLGCVIGPTIFRRKNIGGHRIPLVTKLDGRHTIARDALFRVCAGKILDANLLLLQLDRSIGIGHAHPFLAYCQRAQNGVGEGCLRCALRGIFVVLAQLRALAILVVAQRVVQFAIPTVDDGDLHVLLVGVVLDVGIRMLGDVLLEVVHEAVIRHTHGDLGAIAVGQVFTSIVLTGRRDPLAQVRKLDEHGGEFAHLIVLGTHIARSHLQQRDTFSSVSTPPSDIIWNSRSFVMSADSSSTVTPSAARNGAPEVG